MARMAWFKKERKPRTSERVKLEIPADAWEKCDECGHIDIKDRFVRALNVRSEEHTSELQSRFDLVCRLLLEKKKNKLSDGFPPTVALYWSGLSSTVLF